MGNLAIEEIDGGVVFTAKVVPGASQTCIAGVLDGMLKVRVSAAPEKGKANKCLLEFLGKQLGVKKNALSIISGQTSPVKHIKVLGISGETLVRRLKIKN